MWYVIENEERRGPFTLSQIRGQRAAFLLSAETVIENGLGQRVLVDDFLPEFRPGPLIAAVRLAPLPEPIPAQPPARRAEVPVVRSPFVSEPQPIEVLDLPHGENQETPLPSSASFIPATSASPVTPIRRSTPTASAPASELHPPASKIGDWGFVSLILCAIFSIVTVIALIVVFAARPSGRQIQLWGIVFSFITGSAAALSFLVALVIQHVAALEDRVARLDAELNRLRRNRSRDDELG